MTEGKKSKTKRNVAIGLGLLGLGALAAFLLWPDEAKADDLPDVDDDTDDVIPPPPDDCPAGSHPVLIRRLRKWTCEPGDDEPDCGAGHHAVRDTSTGAWSCVADEPAFPPRPTEIPDPPECDEGLVPVWHGWRASRATRQWIADWRCEPGPEKPECPPGQHLVWQRRLGKWLCVADPVVDDLDDWIKDFPEGNSLYQVRGGDQWLGTRFKISGRRDFSIVYAYIRREAFLAAREFGGMDDAAAMAWAKEVAGRNQVRIQVLNLILCSEFNDTAYGTWGWCGDRAINAGTCPATMRNHPGPHGRAIRLLPQHADNITRLRNDSAAARVVTIGSSATRGDASSKTVAGASGGRLPAIWMPGVNRELVFTSGGNTWTTEGMEHEDGTSTINPPHALFRGRGGIEDFTNLPDGIDFGCEG